MNELPRREFMGSLSAATIAAVAGGAALNAIDSQAADAPPKREFVPGSKDKIEILPRDSADKGNGIDLDVHLQGTFKERTETLASLADWLKQNEKKYASLCIVERGPHRAVFRIGPISKEEKDADSCRPCHMPACTCTCFQTGGAGGNCATCAHSNPDHY